MSVMNDITIRNSIQKKKYRTLLIPEDSEFAESVLDLNDLLTPHESKPILAYGISEIDLSNTQNNLKNKQSNHKQATFEAVSRNRIKKIKPLIDSSAQTIDNYYLYDNVSLAQNPPHLQSCSTGHCPPVSSCTPIYSSLGQIRTNNPNYSSSPLNLYSNIIPDLKTSYFPYYTPNKFNIPYRNPTLHLGCGTNKISYGTKSQTLLNSNHYSNELINKIVEEKMNSIMKPLMKSLSRALPKVPKSNGWKYCGYCGAKILNVDDILGDKSCKMPNQNVRFNDENCNKKSGCYKDKTGNNGYCKIRHDELSRHSSTECHKILFETSSDETL